MNKTKLRAALSLGLVLTVLGLRAGDSPAARDFDLQGFIEHQLQTGTNRVVVPPGRYRVTPRNGMHLRLQNLTDVTVVADGVEMVCTETRLAVGINHCRNLQLRGLTVDYDPLPMTEGRIVALAPDKSWVEFQIIDGYPETHLTERIEIYDPGTGELRRTDANWGGPFQILGNHRYRIAKGAHYHYNPKEDLEQVGDVLVTNNEYPAGAGGHAVILTDCTAVKLESVTVYASPCFGFLEQRGNGNIYLRCKIDRRAPADDPVPRGLARMRSLDADAYHSSEASTGPSIIECTAKFMGDDAVNIHGRYDMVLASTGAVLRVAAPGSLSLTAGDPVEFLPFAGERPGNAAVQSIEPAAGITEAEAAFVQKLNLHERTKETLVTGRAKFYRVTLDHAVPLPAGSLVAAANRLGNGFLVQGCDFGYNRSRGILIKASHGRVIDNTITHGWMAGILVSPEFWWFEAGSSADVTLAGNKIIGCRRTAIEVVAPGGNGRPLASGAHRDITITNNTIAESLWPDIKVTSTANLVLRGNNLGGAARGGTGAEPVSLENCTDPVTQP